MGLLWITLFVISRSFKTPLCSKKGTVVGIVQNNPSLSQGMAQISDSRSILKPNRVIPSMFLIPQPCAYMFLTRLKAPITACRRFDSQSLSSGEGSFGYSATGILEILQGASPSRNPSVSRCHRHNTLRSRSTHCSLTDSADGGLCTWRCLRLNRPNTQATGHGTDSHVIHLLAS